MLWGLPTQAGTIFSPVVSFGVPPRESIAACPPQNNESASQGLTSSNSCWDSFGKEFI
jgi:hypothetical protein